MYRIAVSLLSLFVVFPAFCNARLPVVNVAAGGVSARTAFGETPRNTVTDKKTASTRKIVARPNVMRSATVKPVKQDIVAAVDVLSPRRPSVDLWAQNDSALRMPRSDEFSVLTDNYVLPEESLDSGSQIAVRSIPVQPVKTTEMSELDAQIARLVELQRQADNSTRNIASRSVEETNTIAKIAEPVATITSKPATFVAEQKVANRNEAKQQDAEPIKLSRLVVPMDEPDVVMRSVKKNTSPRIATVRDDMTKMTPTELRKAFRKTFLSENKHLSTYSIDDRFDVSSDMSSSFEGFSAQRDLSEDAGIRPLEIKISFRDSDSALSRENYNLLSEYASIAVSNPKRAIQVAIPESVTHNSDGRKLAARRLAIVEQVLRDTGVSEQRIMPVLSARDDESFVLRIISGEQFETMTKQQRNMFGDTVNKKTYKSMSW